MRCVVMLIAIMMVLFGADDRLWATTNAAFQRGVPVRLSSEEHKWIANQPPLRAGVLTSWPPFSYTLADGTLRGIDIDILRLISQRTGLKFQVMPQKSWEVLVSNWDQLDVVSSVVRSPLRETVAEFTQDYSSSPLVIVEREGEETFGPSAFVNNMKLALPRRYIVTQIVTNRLPSIPVTLTESQEESFELVAHHKADATVADMFVVSQFLNTHPEHKLSISGVIPKSEQPLRLGIHRNQNSPLLSILNKGLASITQQELDDIFAKHLLFGLQSQHRVGLLKKQTREALIAAVLIGAVLFGWNWLMRREICARRKAEADLLEANKSMQIFSHSLSHDLRAPIRGITGLAQALKEDYSDKLDEEGQRYLNHIISCGHHMDKMITDVLTYSRTTNSDWPMVTVQLDPVVHELIAELPAEQREFIKVTSPLPSVRGHPTLLSQCIGNLLTNALRYVPADLTPHVAVHANTQASEVTLFVDDNGIGIKPEDQQRIFRMFERAAPAAYKGTGVGLAVVAKAAERMGGIVGVESEPGKGSRFWLRLRAAHIEEPVSEPTRPSVPFWRRFTMKRGT
jgi:signal transduction histidine kinase